MSIHDPFVQDPEFRSLEIQHMAVQHALRIVQGLGFRSLEIQHLAVQHALRIVHLNDEIKHTPHLLDRAESRPRLLPKHIHYLLQQQLWYSTQQINSRSFFRNRYCTPQLSLAVLRFAFILDGDLAAGVGRRRPLFPWFRVWGLGFRVWGLGFRVQGSGFRV